MFPKRWGLVIAGGEGGDRLKRSISVTSDLCAQCPLCAATKIIG